MSLLKACRCFWKALREPRFAEALLRQETVIAQKQEPSTPPSSPTPSRSPAIELLAALQREGRLVDFLMESIDRYSDAQIGAVARDIHRGCRKTIERMFDIAPLRAEPEGSVLTLPSPPDAALWKVNGGATGARSVRLCHPGWTARRIALPEWHGSEQAGMVIAPAEVEPV